MDGENHEIFQHLDSLSATFTSVEEKVDDDTLLVVNKHEAPSLSDSNKGLETSILIVKDKGMTYRNGVERKIQLSSTIEEYAPGTDLQSKVTNSRNQDGCANSNFNIIYDSGECMMPHETDLQSKGTNSRSHGFKDNSNFEIASGSGGECMTPRETDIQSKGMNSRSQGDDGNSNFDMTCGSGECMTPRDVASSERNESAFESTAGSVVSDREGESLADRLKRQIEYDKERIDSLYKELDEERSASAIAANEAMAMITRLQEEKAALNLEALHYLRMMEEQAEYDVEALEKANDLLSEKEKEIQDLEAVLERSKSKVSDGFIEEHMSEMICTSTDALSSTMGNQNELRGQKHTKYSNVRESEEEKPYIFECLKRLEQTLLKFPGFQSVAPMSNSVNSKLMEDKEPSGSQPGEYCEDNGYCDQTELHVPPNGNIKTVEVKKTKILENKDSDIHDGSDDMETDHDCCELSRMGHEGFLIIKEIAHQLQELRKLVSKEHHVVS